MNTNINIPPLKIDFFIRARDKNQVVGKITGASAVISPKRPERELRRRGIKNEVNGGGGEKQYLRVRDF